MAKKEYIEREAVNAVIKAECSPKVAAYLIDAVATVPAADVRPVVLCRDCKHRFMKPNGWHCRYAEWGIEDDDFCSCGEKREEQDGR